MAAPGWYRDPGSDRLARWFDGQEWTHHTVVMADWRGRGTPAPPEDRTIVQSSHDAYVPPVSGDWAPPTGAVGYEDFDPYDTYGSYEDEDGPAAYGAGGGHYQPTLADRFREAPNWFRLGAPVLALLIVVVAFAAMAGGDDDPKASVDTNGEPDLNEAIELAYDAGFPRELSSIKLGGLIKSACLQVGKEDGAERVADQIKDLGFNGADLSGATRGLKAGGEGFCGDAVAEEDPNFFRDVALAISGSGPSPTTTTTTQATSTTQSSSSTSTTKKSTSTTKKPTTTTKPPATSTSTSTSSTSTTTTTTVGGTDGGGTTEGAEDGGDGD